MIADIAGIDIPLGRPAVGAEDDYGWVKCSGHEQYIALLEKEIEEIGKRAFRVGYFMRAGYIAPIEDPDVYQKAVTMNKEEVEMLERQVKAGWKCYSSFLSRRDSLVMGAPKTYEKTHFWVGDLANLAGRLVVWTGKRWDILE